MHLKCFWTLFKNVHCQGPCILRPCISRPYCSNFYIHVMGHCKHQNQPLFSWPVRNLKTIHKLFRQIFRIFNNPSPKHTVFQYYPLAIWTNFWPHFPSQLSKLFMDNCYPMLFFLLTETFSIISLTLAAFLITVCLKKTFREKKGTTIQMQESNAINEMEILKKRG